MSEIANFSTTLDDKAIWTSNTKICNSIPLYSPDNVISGYIYFLSTEGKDSGYIQIHKSSDSYVTVNLGYNDNSILTELASNYSTSFNNELLHNSKIYFCGDYNYFIDLDNAILDLSNKTLLEKNNETFTQLSSLYQHFIAKFTNIAFLDSADDPGSSGGATVRDLYSAMNYLRTMHYYESQYSSTLDSHCSPTAAANLIIY